MFLGVKKYEIEDRGGVGCGDSIGNFPSDIPKTDELRIQSVPRMLEELKGKPYYISVKCDGSSCTVFHDGTEVRVCSRNMMKSKEGENRFWKSVSKYNVDKLSEYPFIVLQGETCGPGIQKNRLKLKEFDFFVFNVYDRKRGVYLDIKEATEIVAALGMKFVPIIEMCPSFDYSLERLLEAAKGKYDGTDNNREGIVIRPQTEMTFRKGSGLLRLSFKAINNDFLLESEGRE